MLISPRNFARLLSTEIGMTSTKLIDLAPIDAARHYLVSISLSIEVVVEKFGFFDTGRMRRSFLRELAVSPSDYCKRFTESGFDNHQTTPCIHQYHVERVLVKYRNTIFTNNNVLI